MTELLTSAQMRAIEAAAIESGQVTGLELMERAGQGVVDAILAEWPELGQAALPQSRYVDGGDSAGDAEYLRKEKTGGGEKAGPTAVVLCGPGNNGGDGFVVARLLWARGWEVAVYLYGDPERLPPDARVNYERWWAVGVVHDLAVFSEAGPEEWRAAILVDALFGTGLTRPIEGLEFLLRDITDCVEGGVGKPLEPGFETCPCVVSVDIPSGLCADSGQILFPESASENPAWSTRRYAAAANLTVTFHRPKLGHVLDLGPVLCGRIVVVDIGLANLSMETVRETHPPFTAGKHRFPGHKYSYGHALIVSGPPGHGGAARLAARGALRIGAGLVTVGCPAAAVAENAAQLNAIMLREVGGAEDLRDVLSDRRINALCIGPGLGVSNDRADLVGAALDWHLPDAKPLLIDTEHEAQARAESGRHRPSVVLDADALTLLSRDPALFARLHPNCVLTPHAGEFARLFPDIAERLAAPATRGPAYSKVDATRDAAARAGCVVLYKGADTVIAAPGGRCAVNAAVYDRAAPWLATAGSGDVLTGLVTGLLARGFAPFDAACAGAWLHVEAARSFGPGLIAEDLPEELPKIFRTLLP